MSRVRPRVDALLRVKVEATHWALWTVLAVGPQERRVEWGVRWNLRVEVGEHFGFLSLAGSGSRGNDRPVESYPSVSRVGLSVSMPSPVLPGMAGYARMCAQARLGVLYSHAILPATCLGHFLPGRAPGSRVLLGVDLGGSHCQDPKATLGSRGKRGTGLELSQPLPAQ